MNESQISTSLRVGQDTVHYAPGTKVRVTQQIPQRDDVYAIAITGVVVRQERQESGSWFARNKDQRLWLDRLIVEKEDGEKTVLNLDEYTSVEVLGGEKAIAGAAPLVTPSEDPAAALT